MSEQFVIFFTRSGEPRLERLVYDSSNGTYKAKTIPRDSDVSRRALESPAGRCYRDIRDSRKEVVS